MVDSNGAYGAQVGGGDTDFRTKRNREEYAAQAVEREAKEKEESKARYEAKQAGRKYVRRASTPEDAKETEARETRLDVGQMVGKQTLVPAGASIGKKGKGAGFYCKDCDLTYKDSLQWIEHLNSKQHLLATGETGDVKRATLSDVKERLAWLKRKRDEEQAQETVDLQTRLESRREEDNAERAAKRQRRNEKRRKTKDGLGIPEIEVENDGIIT